MDGNKLLSNVSSRYGAPMGRRAITDDPAARVRLFRVRFVDGDYDAGGAYWGGGYGTKPLYAAIGDDFQWFTRANSREEAGRKLLDAFPLVSFRGASQLAEVTI